ncbi:glycosyltransferase family 4 protein [Aureibaculum sp. 2210JD6-5]|uniref:glycosyltransferase family 4 protein n=1 Tax=Aureibaculum sp. 2210JD6-5 TaxID=3103957 RepID=UPI002AAC72C3|nr:glycosyltransferase family 4 protein [Aureibaculum sp. 2210JD6-5]MDY7396595.1 glycosyltransferase family 4 protein [Aureibaculum sp. 2210JD6-5]
MILDKTFPPDPRVENEATSLAENGFEVFLYCLMYRNQNQEYDETLKGFHLRRYLSNKITYKLSALAYTFSFYNNIQAKNISHFLQHNNIDVIHVHDMRIAGAVFKANKDFNLPIVLDLHDNMPEIMKFYPHTQKFPGKYLISPKKWKKKEEEFIQHADKIITVSNEFKQEIISRTKISENKIKVVPNTVNQSFYKDFVENENLVSRYKDDFVILYVGDTGIRRGLLTAIEAIPKIKEAISNVKLVIVGSSSADEILKQKVKDLDVDQYVDFQGWQDVSLFPSYILASSIGISPLYKNIQHDVAYPNKIFQYMSFAKPVLVSNATAQKNIVEKTKSGLVHIEKDVNDFTSKVLSLYNDKTLRNTFGENGKKFIENEFCWEKASKSLIELYENLKN